jgi:hypothetical protein
LYLNYPTEQKEEGSCGFSQQNFGGGGSAENNQGTRPPISSQESIRYNYDSVKNELKGKRVDKYLSVL